MALAMEWSTRITTISLEMVVPAVIGYWLDQRWGTHGTCLILGAVLGFSTAIYSLVKLAQSPIANRRSQRGQTGRTRPPDESAGKQ